MTINERGAERLGSALAGAIHAHWGLFLAEGIVLVILGLAAIILPPIATVAFTIIIGWIFLVSGVIDLVLAVIIFLGLPGTAFWALGLLVGINMLFGGSALIAMALAARHPASA